MHLQLIAFRDEWDQPVAVLRQLDPEIELGRLPVAELPVVIEELLATPRGPAGDAEGVDLSAHAADDRLRD